MKKDEGAMRPDTPDCPLVPYTAKTRFAALLLGVLFGLAVIVPGVSGSTVAIIFGLYTGMLYALGHILGDFRRCFAFLFPIGVGVILGFTVGFVVIQRFFGAYMFVIVCLFVGLMAGASPAILREIRGVGRTPLRLSLLAAGIVLPIALGALSALLSGASGAGETYVDFPLWRYPLYLLLGVAVSVTQVVPGLSATAILMAAGQFSLILGSLHVSYILAHPEVLLLYGCLGVGFLVGIVLVSRGFGALLKRHRTTAFFCVSGLSLGSIGAMFINPDMMQLYRAWGAGESPVFDLAFGALLLVLGFLGSFFLTRYELRHGGTAA